MRRRYIANWHHEMCSPALQVLVGTATSDMYHVFEIKTIVARNSMFVQQPPDDLPRPGGSVTFSLKTGPESVLRWLQTTFSFSGQLTPEGGMAASFLNLRDESALLINAGALPSLADPHKIYSFSASGRLLLEPNS
jgi:hypothetical protein